MLGGADNPNGELPSYITGADMSRHSELAKAFAYTLNQWPALTYYANDGWVEIKMPCGRSVWVVKTSCSSALTMVVSGERYCTA